MNIILTTRQKRFLEQHKERGYFWLNDVILLYATTPSRKEFLNRLALSGIIKETEIGKFMITDLHLFGKEKRETPEIR
mgnify:CR=1 FL=1